MKLEVEIKLKVPDLKLFLQKLGTLRPRRLAERTFEDNFVMDLPQLRLWDKGILLRVRSENGHGSLTLKGPVRSSRLFKVREEIETSCDPAEMVEILQNLGYRIAFRYQKYRTVYPAKAGGGSRRMLPVKVMIDETPIGNYVELEGDPEGVTRLAELLGYSRREFIKDSYHGLFLSYCRKGGRSGRDMVFR